MKAAFLEKPGRLSIRQVKIPDCSNDEVLIQIKHVGICGSDLHYFKFGRIGDHIVSKPHILGHECSGVVHRVGKDVRGFEAGDRVAVEPGVPCNNCEFCKSGMYNLCSDIKFISVPPHNGAFAEYIVHDSQYVFRLPDNVDLEQAALVEPLSVAYNAARLAGLKSGDSVCILGAGSIGFACLELSKALGATQIMATDIDEQKLAVLRAHGADLVVNPARTDVVEEMNTFTSGRGFDCVFEASGSGEAIVMTTKLARKGGNVVWIGLGDDEIQISHYEVVKKEITLKGAYRYANTYKKVIDLLSTGKINVKDWISHRFPLEKIAEAVETALNHSQFTMKIMIYM